MNEWISFNTNNNFMYQNLQWVKFYWIAVIKASNNAYWGRFSSVLFQFFLIFKSQNFVPLKSNILYFYSGHFIFTSLSEMLCKRQPFHNQEDRWPLFSWQDVFSAKKIIKKGVK